MNNDPFKKMDLDFDPTVESKIQPTPNEIKSNQSLDNEIKNTPKEMDETLEFIVQEETAETKKPESQNNDDNKSEKKRANKFRLNAFFWIGIVVLSILFGATSIWNFIQHVIDFADTVTVDKNSGENVPVGLAIWECLKMLGSSLEAFLFVFFISLSLKKFSENWKPWKEYWVKTEPLRTQDKIAHALFENSKLRKAVNESSINYLEIPYQGNTDKEKLNHIINENKDLKLRIKEHKASQKKK